MISSNSAPLPAAAPLFAISAKAGTEENDTQAKSDPTAINVKRRVPFMRLPVYSAMRLFVFQRLRNSASRVLGLNILTSINRLRGENIRVLFTLQVQSMDSQAPTRDTQNYPARMYSYRRSILGDM